MICGIDVGKTGAVALLYPKAAGQDKYLEVYDMPILDNGSVNGAELADLFNELRPEHCLYESVNSFGMGRQSAFVFGRGVGVIEGVLASMKIPHSSVSPAKWKKSFNLGKDKTAARAAATRLFPEAGPWFKLKKHHGRAEAALIALYQHQKGTVT